MPEKSMFPVEPIRRMITFFRPLLLLNHGHQVVKREMVMLVAFMQAVGVEGGRGAMLLISLMISGGIHP